MAVCVGWRTLRDPSLVARSSFTARHWGTAGILRNTRCVLEKPTSVSGKPPVLRPLSPAGRLGGWVDLCRSPVPRGEQECSPDRSAEPNATNTLPCGGAGSERGGGRQSSAWKWSPRAGAADLHLFPPSSWARSLCMTFIPQTALKLGT